MTLPVQSSIFDRKIVALAGGVGGAKLAHGLAQILAPENLTIIVNTGDDFDHWGLRICPDVDTVCYTLAGLANPKTGWGRVDESWQVFEGVAHLGGPDWFSLGDRDLSTHIERTRRLGLGEPLSSITHHFCQSWGVGPRVLPMSDSPISTIVLTEHGELPFQEYFVHQRCEPRVTGFRFDRITEARPAPGVIDALQAAEFVIICPSNPWVSIGPILAVSSIGPVLRNCRVLAVSPIIGGKAVKGPAAKMYSELGIQPSALAVAQQYSDLLTGFVFDTVDADQVEAVEEMGVQTLVTNTLMKTSEDRRRLAAEILDFAERM
jgi:LPPG:FO 2-phospho-L-lactate transferase